jgi:ribosome-associated protein
LQELVDSVAVLPTVRRATKPTLSSQRRRLEGKAKDGERKQLRGKITF